MSKIKSPTIINFCEINLINQTRNEFAEFAVSQSKLMKSLIAFSLNGESLAKFHNDNNFKKLFLRADYVHADGMSIVKFSKILNKNYLPERIATTDWFHDVAKISEVEGVTHYMLGGNQKTIEKTIVNVTLNYPQLKIVGYRNGYFKDSELEGIINEIKQLKPNFIWLSLGRPKQELTAIRLKETCEIGIIKTCGGLFDFLSGNNKRAPIVMQNLGLEWLYRLYLQPNRLFKRYLVTNYQSIKIVLITLIKQRFRKV